MEYMTAREASEAWGMTARQVQCSCKSGRIPGVIRKGNAWLIPQGAARPADRRRKGAALAQPAPLPRQSPFPTMTDLYTTPGSADRVAETLTGDAAALFRAQIAYYRGEVDAVYTGARAILERCSDFETQIGAGILLSLCAMYQGDQKLWFEAQAYLRAAGGAEDAEARAFWLAAADSSLNDTAAYPAWLRRGCFEPLHRDCYPAARFFYVKYLYVVCCEILSGRMEDRTGMPIMHLLPAVIEPLISQSAMEGNLLAEIYLRLICAIAWHNSDEDRLAAMHLDRAIALALPDRLYSPLAE